MRSAKLLLLNTSPVFFPLLKMAQPFAKGKPIRDIFQIRFTVKTTPVRLHHFPLHTSYNRTNFTL